MACCRARKAGLAGGMILGAAGFGNAVGPLLGGLLTDTVGWRWIFFVNLPVAAAAVLIMMLGGSDRRDKDHARNRLSPERRAFRRPAGAVARARLGTGSRLDRAADPLPVRPRRRSRWPRSCLSSAGPATALSFPSIVMQNRAFLAAGIATLLASAIFFAALLYLPQFMSKVLGFTAIGSGAGLLPMMGTFMVTSFIAGRLYELSRAEAHCHAGRAVAGSRHDPALAIIATTTYDQLVLGMVVLGIGVGLFYSSITTAAITALDPSQASLAGAIVYMFQIAGGSIGVGFNTAIVVSSSSMPRGSISHSWWMGCWRSAARR